MSQMLGILDIYMVRPLWTGCCLLCVKLDSFALVSNVKGVGRDQVVALQDLHVVHLEPGPQPVIRTAAGNHPVGYEPGGAE